MDEQQNQALFPEHIARDLRVLCFPFRVEGTFPSLSPLHSGFDVYWIKQKCLIESNLTWYWPFDSILTCHLVQPTHVLNISQFCEGIRNNQSTSPLGHVNIVIKWEPTDKVTNVLWLYSIYTFHTIPDKRHKLVVPKKLSELLAAHYRNGGTRHNQPTAQITAVNIPNCTIEVSVSVAHFIPQVIPVLREYHAATSASECDVKRRLIDDTKELEVKRYLQDDIKINDMQRSVLMRLWTPGDMLFSMGQMCVRFKTNQGRHYVYNPSTKQQVHLSVYRGQVFEQSNRLRIVAETGEGKTLLMILLALRFCTLYSANPSISQEYGPHRGVTIVTKGRELVHQTKEQAERFLNISASNIFTERVKILTYGQWQKHTFSPAQHLVIFDESHTFTNTTTQRFSTSCTSSICITATPHTNWPYNIGDVDFSDTQASMATLLAARNPSRESITVKHVRVLCNMSPEAEQATKTMVKFLLGQFGTFSCYTHKSQRIVKMIHKFFAITGPQHTANFDALVKLTQKRFVNGLKRERDSNDLSTLVKPKNQSKQPSNDICCICLDPLSQNGTVQMSPCVHILHLDCYQMMTSIGKKSCPLCRHRVQRLAVPWYADKQQVVMPSYERETVQFLLTASKLAKFEECVRHLNEGEKVVVYATNHLWYNNITEKLGEIATRHGATLVAAGFRGGPITAKQVCTHIRDFKRATQEKTTLLVLPHEKYAEGLDFADADELWLLHPCMSSTQIHQCSNRTNRYGRQKEVVIRFFVTEKTIESYIVDEVGEVHDLGEAGSDDSLFSLVFYLALELDLLADIDTTWFRGLKMDQLVKLLTTQTLTSAMRDASFFSGHRRGDNRGVDRCSITHNRA
jgi:hypothetical protein